MFASGSGGSRTHSIPGSKPRWSTDCLPSHLNRQYPEQESNLQTLGFKPSRSTCWRIRASVGLDGVEPSSGSYKEPALTIELQAQLGQ